jgi:hypothetical protein
MGAVLVVLAVQHLAVGIEPGEIGTVAERHGEANGTRRFRELAPSQSGTVRRTAPVDFES